MSRRAFLGEFEQMVLLSVLQLGTEAYGPNISRLLEDRAGRQISRGALYSSLERLEGKGLLDWRVEAATSRRRGHRRRRFKVTPKGLRALATSREALLNLWDGVEHLLTGPAR